MDLLGVFGGRGVAFVKKSVPTLLFSKQCFFDRVYKVFLPLEFYNFHWKSWFRQLCISTGFKRVFCGCGGAFVKEMMDVLCLSK